MSERTSSFSSTTSCPSITAPSASDSTLSPSVRSLSPISPLPNVPTFCLTPYPEQSEFPFPISEPTSDSPLSSPTGNHDRKNDYKTAIIEDVDRRKDVPMATILDTASPPSLPSSSVSKDNNQLMTTAKPPVPKRRVTSPSFLIPPTLKMSSLTSPLNSPTKIPLSPGGRSKAPLFAGRPRVGRSATISTSIESSSSSSSSSCGAHPAAIVSTAAIGHGIGIDLQGQGVRILNGEKGSTHPDNDGVRRKPVPVPLNLESTYTRKTSFPSSRVNPRSIRALTRGTSLSTSFSNLTTQPESENGIHVPFSRSETPTPDSVFSPTTFHNNKGEIDDIHSGKTVKPLTAKRVGNNDIIQSQSHRWYTELDLEEPRLGNEQSPGWGEFNV
ncbi:uncharacterized protein IL334_004431 [Kwoniella shivajii]|uniref:Uncharacterized protein n=1 Tax=Kwoniella shivajii TaxID=564305 RepID=A0ABZ1D281_9TREE|nr:hypothetical protein IL334_004431 [Kwoniella shivajii]